MKVLIVEDTQKLAESLAEHFILGGHGSDIAGSLEIAEELLAVTHYDIALLDIMLPDGNGGDFLRRLRRRKIMVPVIVMTARSEVSNRVDLLDIGADDYIIKPFEFAELEARCRAVLRRHSGQDQLALNYGNATLYPLIAMLEAYGEKTSLRNRELRLLEIFFNSPEIIFSKEQLTDRLFSISEEVTDNAIEVYVGRVRKKLHNTNLQIETVRGIGYRLHVND